MKMTLKQSLGNCVPVIHSVGVLTENDVAYLVVNYESCQPSSVLVPTPSEVIHQLRQAEKARN